MEKQNIWSHPCHAIRPRWSFLPAATAIDPAALVAVRSGGRVEIGGLCFGMFWDTLFHFFLVCFFLSSSNCFCFNLLCVFVCFLRCLGRGVCFGEVGMDGASNPGMTFDCWAPLAQPSAVMSLSVCSWWSGFWHDARRRTWAISTEACCRGIAMKDPRVGEEGEHLDEVRGVLLCAKHLTFCSSAKQLFFQTSG